MTTALTRSSIEKAFIAACKAELAALKPGNVHVFAAGHRMQVRDFERSAEAAAPHIANAQLKVGSRIRRAIEATIDTVGCNTNLGIVLLSAPLAAAGQAGEPLEPALARVLSALDRKDAEETFAAIRRANPAGLGKVAEGDVAGQAQLTLLGAMALAAKRDRIAKAYVTDLMDIFEFGLARLRAARRRGGPPEDAVAALYMAFLARFPDSHIARKHGGEVARKVKAMAKDALPFSRNPLTPSARACLLELDRDLKSRGLNPGTTADFVVATLFAETIISLSQGFQS